MSTAEFELLEVCRFGSSSPELDARSLNPAGLLHELLDVSGGQNAG